MDGKFINIDGIEGTGKSTQIECLEKILIEKGIHTVKTREPGGSPTGDKIRELLLSSNTHIHSDTELLLLFAARNEHIQQKILPALKRGSWVLSDRFTDATYAYQGGGRGISDKRIRILENWLQQGLTPDLSFFLDMPPKLALTRIKNRSKDRIESENLLFFERVRAVYLARAKTLLDKVVIIDARASIEQITQQMMTHITKIIYKQ